MNEGTWIIMDSRFQKGKERLRKQTNQDIFSHVMILNQVKWKLGFKVH
jgi:hypothetical protein